MMNKKQTTADVHEFALFYPTLSALKALAKDRELMLDEQTSHRIRSVLRLELGESIILFDGMRVITAVVSGYEGKRGCRISVTKIATIIPLKPSVTFYLPLLKREALESALYSLVETGVTTIQLVSTAKTQRLLQDNDYQRLERIMIAAAEQSKNFAMPELKKICTFEALLEKHSIGIRSLFFDAHGSPLAEVLSELIAHRDEPIFCMIGPEGDLTEHEKKQLIDRGFTFCALTPTILRSCQAVAVGAALIRSIMQ